MKIRIVDACLVRGAHAEPGSVHDLPDAEGLLVLSSGRAVRHVAPPPVAPAASPAPETPAPVEPVDPAPALGLGTEAATAAPVTEAAAVPAPAARKRKA